MLVVPLAIVAKTIPTSIWQRIAVRLNVAARWTRVIVVIHALVSRFIDLASRVERLAFCHCGFILFWAGLRDHLMWVARWDWGAVSYPVDHPTLRTSVRQHNLFVQAPSSCAKPVRRALPQ